jgi:lipid-A-disaccharide synthase
MIIAGESSGDQHGAKLVQAMRERDAGLFFCGIGGPALKAAGVRIVVDAASLAVVGLTEVLSKLPTVFRGLAVAKKLLTSLRPDLLILIDFPDFNFRVAACAKKLDIPVLYYISPQIWAWRQGRVKMIAQRVDHMAVILPFEAEFYRDHHVPVTFVGHPLLDRSPATDSRPIPEVFDNPGVIGLLPGSRPVEIQRLLPIMLEAAKLMRTRDPGLHFAVSVAPMLRPEMIEAIVKQHGAEDIVSLAHAPVETLFKHCRLVVAASGTVTLQTAIAGIPMVIIYKVSPFSFWLGKALVKVEHAGLINLIAQKSLVPELIQDDATPEKIAATVFDLLQNDVRLERMRRDLGDAVQKLGGSGASARAAEIALNMLKS